ncbi:DUF246 domain-containing protein [Spatholobus suberectus]|nr:DUF246 domain-containing protein [Spatholobus suberectus]
MRSHLFSGCSIAGVNFAKANVKTHPDQHLLIATSGGLNQQRTRFCPLYYYHQKHPLNYFLLFIFTIT